MTYNCVEFLTTSLFTSRPGTYTFNIQAELTLTPSITGSSILATIEVICGAETILFSEGSHLIPTVIFAKDTNTNNRDSFATDHYSDFKSWFSVETPKF